MTKIESVGWKVVMGMVIFIAGFGWQDLSDGTYLFYIWLHELGHVLFGGGGVIWGNVAYINVDWIGATMGSMIGFHLYAVYFVAFAVRYFRPLAGFGFGMSAFVTFDVFRYEDGQFMYDMMHWTPAWRPVTILGNAAVVATFVFVLSTGRITILSKAKAWWIRAFATYKRDMEEAKRGSVRRSDGRPHNGKTKSESWSTNCSPTP